VTFFFKKDNVFCTLPGKVIGRAGAHYTASNNYGICSIWYGHIFPYLENTRFHAFG
jgi:hypothetical protein